MKKNIDIEGCKAFLILVFLIGFFIYLFFNIIFVIFIILFVVLLIPSKKGIITFKEIFFNDNIKKILKVFLTVAVHSGLLSCIDYFLPKLNNKKLIKILENIKKQGILILEKSKEPKLKEINVDFISENKKKKLTKFIDTISNIKHKNITENKKNTENIEKIKDSGYIDLDTISDIDLDNNLIKEQKSLLDTKKEILDKKKEEKNIHKNSDTLKQKKDLDFSKKETKQLINNNDSFLTKNKDNLFSSNKSSFLTKNKDINSIFGKKD